MACTKQTARKGNKGLPKATKGGTGCGGNGDGKGNETVGAQASCCSAKAEKTVCEGIQGDEKITADHEVAYIQVSDGKVSHFKSKSTFMM